LVGEEAMATETSTVNIIPWWKEPTKDQWLAWWAAWLGWTLDAFDFTVFLLIMVPIAKEFGDTSHRRVHRHVVDALGGRGGIGLARRSDWAQDAADDLNLVVLDL